MNTGTGPTRPSRVNNRDQESTALTLMRIRSKLIVLLCGFAVFAVLAASATIYAVHWRIESAVENFEQTIGETVRIERLQLALTKQLLYLKGVINGDADATERFFAGRDECLTRLKQTARFTQDAGDRVRSAELLRLTESFELATDTCLARLDHGDTAGARVVFTNRIEKEIEPEITSHLRDAVRRLEAARNTAARGLSTISQQIFGLTLSVGAFGVLLVIIGAMLIRRWLMTPMTSLAIAADHYRDGDFSFRVRAGSDDELGHLGQALNDMAQSVAKAQSDLRSSEVKYRSLFRNLRDAVVIVDVKTNIVEFHEGEAQSLGIEGQQHIGRPLLEVWPEWTTATPDWPGVITFAVVHGKRFRATDVAIPQPNLPDSNAMLDFLVYRIEVGEERLAAIVVRDMSDRHRLQRKLRQAETMEAVGTLAGGLAHDFNNLLASVTGSLSLLAPDIANPAHAERIRTVLKTCWQASALSRKLLNFATSAHGSPQTFSIGHTITTILDSFDPSFFEGVTIKKQLTAEITVRMDPDQFTQIVLNLLRNARDAMPQGGTISVSIAHSTECHPDEPSHENTFGVLTVQDTGIGMSPDVQRRIFEPLFTTKSRAARRGRGLGLSVAYSAVKNASGFIRIESVPNQGTTFRVYLPPGDAPLHAVPLQTNAEESKRTTVLLVDHDPLVLQTWSDALTQWHYDVLTATSMEQARQAPAKASWPLRLAVIDGQFEENQGLALAQCLVTAQPDLRVILTTGSVKQEIPDELQATIVDQLVKPFTLEALRAALEHAAMTDATPKTP